MSKSDTDQDENGQVPMAFSGGGSGINREEMAAKYLPPEEDWGSKSVLEMNDPALIAALRQLDQMYPEVEDLQPIVDDVLDNFLKNKTSIGGASRQEYSNILMSMFGGKNDNEDGASKLAAALAGDLDDDD